MPVIKHRLAATEGVVVEEVRCHTRRSGWSAPEPVPGLGLVFVRRGVFVRRVRGDAHVVDACAAYFEHPGDEQQILHPADGGDLCTAFALSDSLVRSVWPEHARLTLRPFLTGPKADLQCRLLARRARSGDHFGTQERVVNLVGAAASAAGEGRDGPPGAVTLPSRRRYAQAAREAIAAGEPDASSLVALAGRLGVSTFYLSRAFHETVGITMSEYRLRLRARLALQHLEEGAEDLAALAVDLGYADHAHLTRSIRRETGRTPSSLRRLLRVDRAV